MTTNATLTAMSLDCPDPHALATFYARLIGVELGHDTEDFAGIAVEGVLLGFQRVNNYQPPTWPDSAIPQQAHLDFSVADLEAGEASALSLGATKAAVQPNPERWRVMIDPVGHPFCISAKPAE